MAPLWASTVARVRYGTVPLKSRAKIGGFANLLPWARIAGCGRFASSSLRFRKANTILARIHRVAWSTMPIITSLCYVSRNFLRKSRCLWSGDEVGNVSGSGPRALLELKTLSWRVLRRNPPVLGRFFFCPVYVCAAKGVFDLL